MDNQRVAKILAEIGEMLEIKGEQFKPVAYQRAAQVIRNLSEDVREVAREGRLEELPSIGAGIGAKIFELVEKGRLKYYDDLKNELPMDVDALMHVTGLGPKRIKVLYDELGIKTVKDLKKAARERRIEKIEGFGKKIQEQVRRAHKQIGRFLISTAQNIASQIMNELKDVEIAGSYRRRKETVGDIDVLTTNPKIADKFINMKSVNKLLLKGQKKCAVKLHNGAQVDLRIVDKESYGAAMQYFTGSKEHNVKLRKLALGKGYTLNEYGLYTLDKKFVTANEKDIYKRLGLRYIEPELREDEGEIEAAAKDALPALMPLNTLKGDFQVHTTYSDGKSTLKEMVNKAQKIGHKFIVITDHVGPIGIYNGLNEERLKKQRLEILKLNTKIKVFHGAEVEILKDGTLALSKKWQRKLDFVLAAMHHATNVDAICKAIENNRVHALAHPTGRVINKREAYPGDYNKLFACCKKYGVLLDINAHPTRMDLDGRHVRQAKGCKFVISSDSHHVDEMENVWFGEYIARRGWLEAGDVLNTYSVSKVQKFLKSKP